MKKVIVIADRGRVRVLRVTTDELSGEPAHLVEVTEEVVNESPERISDVVTDQQGRFGGGGNAGAAAGERHGLESEMERQNLNGLAAQIEAAVSRSVKDGCWVLAAPQTILKQLEEKLSPAARGVLVNRVAGDLTKLPLKELEKRFI